MKKILMVLVAILAMAMFATAETVDFAFSNDVFGGIRIGVLNM